MLTIDSKEQIVSESLRWQLNGFLNEVESPVELRSPIAQWRRAMLFTNGRVEHLPYWEWSLVPGTLGSHKASRSGPSPFSQIQNLLPRKTECTALSTDYTLQEHRDQLKKKKKTDPYLYVTLIVDEQVLWLKISVDEIQRVKVFKGQYNLGCVEAGVWFTTKQITNNVYSQPVVHKKYWWG